MPKLGVDPESLRTEAMSFSLMAWSENLRAFDDAAELLLAAAERIEELETSEVDKS